MGTLPLTIRTCLIEGCPDRDRDHDQSPSVSNYTIVRNSIYETYRKRKAEKKMDKTILEEEYKMYALRRTYLHL